MIWFRDVEDGIVLDQDGNIPVFNSREDLTRFATSTHLSIQDVDSQVRDLDNIQRWLMFPEDCSIDCSAFLAAWKMFQDIALSLHLRYSGTAYSELNNRIYEKLFWASRAGAAYSLAWTEEEQKRLRLIMLEGFSLLRTNVKFCA